MQLITNEIKQLPSANHVLTDSQAFFAHIVLLLHLGNTPEEIIKSFYDFLNHQEPDYDDAG